MTIYEVDLVPGLDIAGQCAASRSLRTLCTFTPYEPADDVFPLRIAWLQQRVRKLPGPARIQAGKRWPRDIPRKSELFTGHDQIDAVVRVLSQVEAEHGLPFPEPDPRDEPTPTRRVNSPAPAPRRDPRQEATEWGERGRALFATLDDDLARVCAELAGCAEVRMTQLYYEALDAVVTQVADPGGVIRADWGPDGPYVVVVDDAETVLADGGTKRAALDAARRLAKAHGLPSPRSLAQAAENPLLAALVASGTDPQETDIKE